MVEFLPARPIINNVKTKSGERGGSPILLDGIGVHKNHPGDRRCAATQPAN